MAQPPAAVAAYRDARRWMEKAQAPDGTLQAWVAAEARFSAALRASHPDQTDCHSSRLKCRRCVLASHNPLVQAHAA